jgi:SAM-dependent methyltransferase
VAAIYKSTDVFGSERAEGYSGYANDISAIFRTHELQLRKIEGELGGKGRVLEFGCRHGHFGAAAKARGWDTFVTDFSETMVQRANKDYELSAFVAPTTGVPLQKEKFDLIVAHDIIQNLSHPVEVLKQLGEGLDPRGLLVLTTPNFSSLWARLLGRKWIYFSKEDSLLFLNPKNLRKLLEKSGFYVVDISAHSEFMPIGELLTRLQHYTKWLGRSLLFLAKLFGRDHSQVQSKTGKMTVLARKIGVTLKRKDYSNVRVQTPILGVVCCPNCSNALYPQGMEIVCVECNSAFEVESGVINFSKYAKRMKQSV